MNSRLLIIVASLPSLRYSPLLPKPQPRVNHAIRGTRPARSPDAPCYCQQDFGVAPSPPLEERVGERSSRVSNPTEPTWHLVHTRPPLPSPLPASGERETPSIAHRQCYDAAPPAPTDCAVCLPSAPYAKLRQPTRPNAQVKADPIDTVVLSVRALRKAYGATVAVDGISFEVRRKEILGLLGPQRRREDHDHQHGARRAAAGFRLHPYRREELGDPPFPGAGADQLRRRLCSAARESDRAAESARLRPAVWDRETPRTHRAVDPAVRSGEAAPREVRRALLGRADAGGAGQGDAQPAAPAAAG